MIDFFISFRFLAERIIFPYFDTIFFIANQRKRKICYFGFHFLFPKVGRERGGNYQVRSETDCSSEISKSPLKCA